jgi:hypothetical protein
MTTSNKVLGHDQPMRLVAEQGQDGDRMAMAALQRKMDISEAAAKQTRLERFETAHSRVFYSVCREGLCSGETQRVGAGAAWLAVVIWLGRAWWFEVDLKQQERKIMKTRHSFWHWPDKIIRKRESRRLRDEHNAAVNDAEMLLEALLGIHGLTSISSLGFMPDVKKIAETAIAKAKGGASWDYCEPL